MQIYSETILSFLKKVKTQAKSILREEMRLDYRRSRVLHRNHLYPIHFVVFEDPKKWGYFDPHNWQIGINKHLMYRAKDQVIKDVLRHELAHFYQFMMEGKLDGHGLDFKNICRQFGWDQSVYKAVSNLEMENNSIEGDLGSEALMEKIKKLLSLASSSNPHEAQLATIKANQLMTKHNLRCINNNEDEVCLKRVAYSSRNNAKLQAIYDILTTFMVQPVFNHGKNKVYIEVIGVRINVQIADYVANFLDRELDVLWLQTKKENPKLKGLTAKNSFLKGIAKGFLSKQKEFQQSEVTGKELLSLKNQLQGQVDMVYGRLSKGRTSKSKTDKDSQDLGKKIGKSLNIRRGLDNSDSTRIKLLT